MTNNIYFSEIAILCEELAKANIPFRVRLLNGGYQVYNRKFSAVCHDDSIGHRLGLLEILFKETGEIVGNVEACEALDLWEDDLR